MANLILKTLYFLLKLTYFLVKSAFRQFKQEGHDGPGLLTWVSLEPNYFKIFIPVKLFQKLSTYLAEKVIKSVFLFIALAAILFNVVKSFEQFW